MREIVVVADARQDLLEIGEYVIGYRFDSTTLTVVRALHGHRDFRVAFKGENP